MKKTLALLLALMMILTVSLTACDGGNTPNNSGDDFEDDDGFVMNTGNQTEDTDDTNADTNNSGNWEPVSVTIFVLGNGLNIRSAADTR